MALLLLNILNFHYQVNNRFYEIKRIFQIFLINMREQILLKKIEKLLFFQDTRTGSILMKILHQD